MNQTIEINQGEVKVKFSTPKNGKITFEQLGFKPEDLNFENGLIRLVFDLENIGEHHYYQVPTIEIAYMEEMGETHWQCDFNDETILDKMDHHGHSTVILLSRKKLEELEHRHINTLVVHGEFPKSVQLNLEKSYINFFK